MPPTPGKSPPKTVDRELERVSMLARAMEPTAPEVVEVRENLRQMSVKKKSARGEGEADATATSSAAQKDDATKRLGRIPRKEGGGDTDMSHNRVADRPADAARNRRQGEEGDKRRDKGKKAYRGKDLRCYNCKQPGHKARYCRSRPADRKRKRYDSESSGDEEESATQKKMREMAKKLARGARNFDVAMMAAEALKIDA